VCFRGRPEDADERTCFQAEAVARVRRIPPRKVRNVLLADKLKWRDLPDGNSYWQDDVLEEHEQRSVQAFVDRLAEELVPPVRWAFRTLRWTQNLPGPPDPLLPMAPEWSQDGENWLPLPPKSRWLPFDLNFRTLDCSTDAIAMAERLMSDRIEEPVAHLLFREAWTQRFENPRSALVIGMAAAEIGVKDFVVHKLSKDGGHGGWLMLEMQSPDLLKLVSVLLPKLVGQDVPRFVTGKVQGDYKDQVLDLLQKGVTLRNEVVHRPSDAPDVAVVGKVLAAVNDLLWLLDLIHPLKLLPEVRGETGAPGGLRHTRS
jgi:hypothetical protein